MNLPRFIGKRVRLAGGLITAKVASTKHGDPMEFLTSEDETGFVETTFFPQGYRRLCYMIDRDRPYLLKQGGKRLGGDLPDSGQGGLNHPLMRQVFRFNYLRSSVGNVRYARGLIGLPSAQISEKTQP